MAKRKLTAGTYIPNRESIASTFTEYRVLGVVDVLMEWFQSDPHELFYAANDIERCERLAAEIAESGRIDPLIVAFDDDGPYILEGAHRLGALHLLGATEFPALLVEDLS